MTIYHFGAIVVNSNTRVGRNCCIHNFVNIGATGGHSECPKIGNNVFIGPGAVIFGDVTIADGCYIGANTVVNKSILEPYSVVVGKGNSAETVKKETKTWWEKNKLKREI